MKTTLDKESLWKQYQLHIDLYKHYLELVVKFNVFYYAVTGAIVSFYFSKTDVPLIKYSLLFPIVLSLGFGGFFIYAASLMSPIRDEIFSIRDELGLYSAPEVRVLSVVLCISAIMFLVVAISLGLLFYFPLPINHANVS
jgi:hypothetical protein